VSILSLYYIAQGFPPESGIGFRASGVGGMGYGLCEAWIVIQTRKGKREKRSSCGFGLEASDDGLLGKQGVFDLQIIANYA